MIKKIGCVDQKKVLVFTKNERVISSDNSYYLFTVPLEGSLYLINNVKDIGIF